MQLSFCSRVSEIFLAFQCSIRAIEQLHKQPMKTKSNTYLIMAGPAELASASQFVS